MKVVNYKIIKRALDIIVSFILLVICILPMLLIAIIIKIDSPGPIIFKQKRYGKNKKVFEIYKFRGMHKDTPSLPPYKFRQADKYITRVGRILRKTSLDELPQLVNVIKGDMSLVGPRPGAAKNEEKLAKLRQDQGIFTLRPGVTGWAQVNGRDELAHDEEAKVSHDKYYLENMSLKLDLICILKTFGVVASGHGYQEGSVPTNNKIVKTSQK